MTTKNKQSIQEEEYKIPYKFMEKFYVLLYLFKGYLPVDLYYKFRYGYFKKYLAKGSLKKSRSVLAVCKKAYSYSLKKSSCFRMKHSL